MEGKKTKTQVVIEHQAGKAGIIFDLIFFRNKLWEGLEVSICPACSGAALRCSIISLDQVCFPGF